MAGRFEASSSAPAVSQRMRAILPAHTGSLRYNLDGGWNVSVAGRYYLGSTILNGY